MTWFDTLLERFFAVVGFTGPLTRQDRPRWAAARSLGDLGELVAAWLQGEIASQPGYYGSVDVDEQEAPGLTAALVALNRAGYVTYGSQAGFDGLDHDGAAWTQLAAVTGFADPDTYAWLCRVLTGTQFRIIAWPCKAKPWHRSGRGVVVTRREGRPVTRFGGQLGAQSIAGELYAGVGDEAIEALCGALQVTIYDPTPGPNDLWTVLYRPAAAALFDRSPGAPGEDPQHLEDLPVDDPARLQRLGDLAAGVVCGFGARGATLEQVVAALAADGVVADAVAVTAGLGIVAGQTDRLRQPQPHGRYFWDDSLRRDRTGG